MKTNIFQMYYDDNSRYQLDGGFIPLENPGNPRADWREYWPMRKYFLENVLNEDELYGFLSPAFGNKSRLSSNQVHEFIQANPGHDVYHFSPLRQDSLCYLNIFEHGNRFHPGMIEVTNTFLHEIELSVDFTDLVMDLRTTAFCNYIIAKPVFWQKWFAITERIFEISEYGNNSFSNQLNGLTDYRYKSPVGMKVFLIERIASLIFSLDSELSIAAYDIDKMPWSETTYYPYRDEMMTLNALKLAYAHTRNKTYLRNFFDLRKIILEKCDPLYLNDGKLHFF